MTRTGLCMRRWLHMQEWQGKELLRRHSIPTQRSQCVTHEDLIDDSVCGSKVVVVKAQCDVGGRGKGHFAGNKTLRGVQVLKSPSLEHIKTTVKGMLNGRLITDQSGPEGVLIERVLVVEGTESLGRELYAAISLDRAIGCPVLLISSRGGSDIEDHPEAIHRVPIHDHHPIDYDFVANLIGVPKRETRRLLVNMLAAFYGSDATLLEINPLSHLGARLVAIDAKVTIDDNALFRHPGLIYKPSSSTEEGNHVRIEGGGRRIGCMVNGAGLALATMDMLQNRAANFMDIGGSATSDRVASALLGLVAGDPRVRVLLVNVFGGIVRCELVAEGILEARRAIEPSKVPRFVVRMAGTNAQLGLSMLSGVPGIVSVADFESAINTAILADDTVT